MKYFDELKKAMEKLATNQQVLFMGQAVEYKGTGVTRQLENIKAYQKLELPVAEEFQAGMALGMALEGIIPVCIYPRWNFVLLAANQIVNHIDKWPLMSNHLSIPKVIIKVVAGSERPLDPGYQHKGDYSIAFRSMCDTIEVVQLNEPEDIAPAYNYAMSIPGSIILVEYGDFYSEK